MQNAIFFLVKNEMSAQQQQQQRTYIISQVKSWQDIYSVHRPYPYLDRQRETVFDKL